MTQTAENVELTKEGAAAAEVLSFVDQFKEASDMPEVKNLLELVNKDKTENGSEVKKPIEKKPSSKVAVKNKSPFYSNASEEEDQEENDIPQFQKKEEIEDYVKSNFGVETLPEFINQAKTWKDNSEKSETSIKQVEEFTNFFSALPEELFALMQDYNDGKDWRKTASLLSSNGVDFSKDVSMQDKFNLLSRYMPNTYTKEDMEDIDNNPALKKAISAAEQLFTNERMNVISNKENVQKQTIEKTEKINTSVSTSVSELKKSFPGLSKVAIENVTKQLKTGSYRDLLLNKDGTFTKEAALRVAMAIYGEQSIREAFEKGQSKGNSKATEKVLSRADKEVDTSAGREDGVNKNPLNALPKQNLSMLKSIAGNRQNKLSARPA